MKEGNMSGKPFPLIPAKNLSDVASASTARTNLGLGSLATQNGTFSGTSSGTNTGDQNVFTTIAVSGQSDVVADSTSDTLTLVAGSNITITTSAGGDSITIAASGGGGGIGGSIADTQIAFGDGTDIAGDAAFLFTTENTGTTKRITLGSCFIEVNEASTPGVFEHLKLTAVENLDLLTTVGTIVITPTTTCDITNLKLVTAMNANGQTINNIAYLTDSGNVNAVDVTNRYLIGTDGSTVTVDWPNTNLQDLGAVLAMSWNNRTCYYTDGTTVVLNWATQQLIDTSAVLSIDWAARQASDASAQITLDWNNQYPAVANVTGGAQTTDLDVEARAAIDEILAALRQYKIIET